MMFEVAVSDSVKQLDKIKQELDKFSTDYASKLKLKVEIDNLNSLTQALSQIGDNKNLRNLREEITELNKQFLQLSKGAGGVGDINARGLSQSAEKAKQEWEDAVKRLERYRNEYNSILEERSKYNKNTPNYTSLTRDLDTKNTQIEGLEKKIPNLKAAYEQLAKDAANASRTAANSTKEWEAEISKLKAQIDSLRANPVNVNIGGEFKTWAEQVQTLVAKVNELVAEFQKLRQVQGQSNAASSVKSQANEVKQEVSQFTELDRVVRGLEIEVGKLVSAFSKLSSADGLTNLQLHFDAINTAITQLATTLSTLSNAIKLQPIDEQVKALLERAETAEKKLKEVGDAARYLNERAGERTQQKASNIAGIAGVEEEKVEKVSNLLERYRKLLADVQNQYASLGKVQNVAEQLGINPAVLERASKSFELLWKSIENSISGTEVHKGFPVLDKTSDQLAKMRSEFSALKSEYRQVTQEADRYNKTTEKTALKAAAEQAKVVAANMKQAQSQADKLKVSISNLEAFATKADALGIDTAKLRALINDLNLYRKTMVDIASGRSSQNVRKFITADFFLETKRDVKDVARTIKKEMNDALKPNNEAAGALKEYISLLRQITSLTRTANKGESLGIDVQTLRNQIALLEQYANQLKAIVANKGVGFNAWMQATPNYTAARGNIASDQARMNTEIENAKKLNSSATIQLSESEQRLANAVHGSTDSMRGQSQVLSDLRMMAMQYLSVWGAQSFINNIIETGGQLEQQRLSLSAILGDMEKATTLFEQIKQMALKSPFGVVELDKMSKQLAAYSFEYNELFEWTKRLADISAATGTSVDRLALALGHVRSEGALSGYTLRQFAMANVPVLRMLSENLGISSKEVRERVRKKEISADDVQDILRQLTDDGGMFANAQELMSEALNAKFKNLRDAFDIMYGEIAEGGVGDALKDLAMVLTQGAKHWERLGKDMLYVAGTMGIAKVAMLAYNNALGAGTASTLRSAVASKQKEVANLRLTASYRQLTTAEQFDIATSGKLNSRNLAVLLSTNKLTVAQLERAVAMGRVGKADAIAALRLNNLNTSTMASVTVLGRWSRMWQVLSFNIRLAGLALKSMMMSVAPLLALTAVFELFNRRSEQKDAAKDMAGSMAGVAPGREAFDLRGTLGDSRRLSDEALQSNIESMKEALVAANAYTDALKKQVDEIDSLEGKYDLLKKKLDDVADKYEETKNVQEAALKDALDAGGGWFSDNMLEDAKDYDSAFNEYTKALTVGSKQIKEAIKNWMEANGLFKKEYDGMTGKQMFEQLSSQDQSRFLGGGDRNIYRSRGYDESTRDVLENIAIARNKVGSALSEMKEAQGEEFSSIMKSVYEEAFKVDLDKASDEQKIAFDKWLRETLSRAEGLSKDAQDALRNIVIDFTIKLVPHYQVEKPKTATDVVKDQIGDNAWLSGFFGRQNGVNPGNAPATMTVEEAEKSVKKYKQLFGDISLSNLDTAPKKLNTLLDGLEETKKNLKNTLSDGMLSDDEKKQIRKNLDDTTKSIDLANKALADVGGKRKRKGEKKSGSGEDKEAKVLREKVRILKEAADSYQYWREKVGESSAEIHMQDEFGTLLKDQSLQLNNSDELKAKLKELRNEYSKKPQTKPMVEAIKEIDKELANLFRKDYEKKVEEFTSKVQNELDSLTRAWEIFNNVRNATGNIDLAVQISGAGYANGQTRNLADALRQKIEKDYAKTGVQPIAFNMALDDRSIKKEVEKAFAQNRPQQKKGESDEAYATRLQDYEMRISGIVEEYKRWRDLQRDVLKGDIDVFNSIIGSAVDYESQLKKINDSYDRRKASLDARLANGTIKQGDYNQAFGILDAETEAKRWQASQSYIDLMNNSLAMTRVEIEAAAKTQEDSLNKQLESGLITIKQYSDEMAKLRGITSNYRLETTGRYSNRFTAFMTGGGEGLQEYYRRRANQYRTAYNNATYKDSPEAQEALKQTQHYDDLSEKQKKAADTAQDMTDSLGKMKSAVDLVTQFLDAIGGGDETLSGFGDMLGGAMNGASAGAAFGPYGAAIGGALGAVTSIMQMSDKEAQKTIEALKENSKAIEANTAMIETNRERTLGYDTGDLRRRLLQLEKNRISNEDYMLDIGLIKVTNPVGDAMKDFYSRNAGLTGYQQQLEDLKEQKVIYQKMYATEESKKKASGEALAEYKQKIAELEDEILYFTEDLANELWGIDFKSWADQISDALWTAFENGEDAVKAFRDTANDIIADVAKKMMNIHFIEPAFKELETQLFGGVDSNGNVVKGAAYNEDTGTWNEDETLRILGKFFGEDGEFAKVINNSEAFYKMAERVAGVDFSSNGESSMSGTIKGITEQTADLLASYTNEIRADVSVNRQMIAQYFPMYYEVLTNGSTSLRNIENHTAAIMRSNDAIERSNQAILDNFNGLKNKAWRVPMA